MVKVIPITLFDNQKVISVAEEPVALSVAEENCFLIATKEGFSFLLLQFLFSFLFSFEITIFLKKIKGKVKHYKTGLESVLINEFKTVSSVIMIDFIKISERSFSLFKISKKSLSDFFFCFKSVVTIEKENSKSEISVVRIYKDWKSKFSTLEESKGREGQKKGGEGKMKVTEISLSSSIKQIATCPVSNNILLSTFSTLYMYSVGEEEVLQMFEMDVPPDLSTISLYLNYLAYSTTFEVKVLSLSFHSSFSKSEKSGVDIIDSFPPSTSQFLSSPLSPLPPFSLHFSHTLTNSKKKEKEGKGGEERNSEGTFGKVMGSVGEVEQIDEVKEDEYYVECCFEEGKKKKHLMMMEMHLPSLNPSLPFDDPFEITGPLADVDSGIRPNTEEGFKLLSSTLLLHKKLSEESGEIHSLLFLPQYKLLLDPAKAFQTFESTQKQEDNEQNEEREKEEKEKEKGEKEKEKNEKEKKEKEGSECVRLLVGASNEGFLYDISSPSLLSHYPFSTETSSCFASESFLYTLTCSSKGINGIEVYSLRRSLEIPPVDNNNPHPLSELEYRKSAPLENNSPYSSWGGGVGSESNGKRFPRPCIFSSLPFPGLRKVIVCNDTLILLSKISETVNSSSSTSSPKKGFKFGFFGKQSSKEENKQVSENSNNNDSGKEKKQVSVSWSVYVLHPISVAQFWQELIKKAISHKESNPEFYFQLCVEAFLFLVSKMSTLSHSLSLLSPSPSSFPTQSKRKKGKGAEKEGKEGKWRKVLEELEKSESNLTIDAASLYSLKIAFSNYLTLLKSNCSMLADYYAFHLKNYEKSALFYSMTDRKLSEVVRLLLPSKEAAKALVFYLNNVLFDPKKMEIVEDNDTLGNSLMEHYFKYQPHLLSSVVLYSSLSSYSQQLVIEQLSILSKSPPLSLPPLSSPPLSLPPLSSPPLSLPPLSSPPLSLPPLSSILTPSSPLLSSILTPSSFLPPLSSPLHFSPPPSSVSSFFSERDLFVKGLLELDVGQLSSALHSFSLLSPPLLFRFVVENVQLLEEDISLSLSPSSENNGEEKEEEEDVTSFSFSSETKPSLNQQQEEGEEGEGKEEREEEEEMPSLGRALLMSTPFCMLEIVLELSRQNRFPLLSAIGLFTCCEVEELNLIDLNGSLSSLKKPLSSSQIALLMLFLERTLHSNLFPSQLDFISKLLSHLYSLLLPNTSNTSTSNTSTSNALNCSSHSFSSLFLSSFPSLPPFTPNNFFSLFFSPKNQIDSIDNCHKVPFTLVNEQREEEDKFLFFYKRNLHFHAHFLMEMRAEWLNFMPPLQPLKHRKELFEKGEGKEEDGKIGFSSNPQQILSLFNSQYKPFKSGITKEESLNENFYHFKLQSLLSFLSSRKHTTLITQITLQILFPQQILPNFTSSLKSSKQSSPPLPLSPNSPQIEETKQLLGDKEETSYSYKDALKLLIFPSHGMLEVLGRRRE